MAETRAHDADGEVAPSAAQAFAILWSELVSVLGTAAAATLLRRAGKRASAQVDELKDLQVVREGWEYRYSVPAAWEEQSPRQARALVHLVCAELVPLLRELTGEIVVNHLSRVAVLRPICLADLEEESS